MNEYVIHAKVKNNLIFQRIRDAGFETVSAFCRAHKLQDSVVGEFINMKRPALNKSGDWSGLAMRLAEALGVLPDELFTEEQATLALKRNTAYIEMSREQALSMTDPAVLLEQHDLLGKLIANAHLSPRQEKVLMLRYANEKTLNEVGEALNLSGARVRQIEETALTKLRITSSHDQYF